MHRRRFSSVAGMNAAVILAVIAALAAEIPNGYAQSAQDGAKIPAADEQDPAAAQRWNPRTSEETLQRLQRISASTEFGNCCFWAWQLELAILKKNRDVAQRIATVLAGLQRADGRWGLGNSWGKRPIDFKERRPEDAECWDVAESSTT